MINIPEDCGCQVVGNMMRSSENHSNGYRGAKPEYKHTEVTDIVSRLYVPGEGEG